MKQIPDDDVMANESVKMVQRQGFLIHKKHPVLGVGLIHQPAASDCWITLAMKKFRCSKMVSTLA